MLIKLSNSVENILAKGEIARFEQFLFLSQCFRKLSAAEVSESVYMWERVKNSFQQYNDYTCTCIHNGYLPSLKANDVFHLELQF